MSFAELIPALQALPRADKLRVIQFLAGDLARQKDAELFPAEASCPTWSPFHAFDAAKTLMQMLEQVCGTKPKQSGWPLKPMPGGRVECRDVQLVE
jgi:hypothetical protein